MGGRRGGDIWPKRPGPEWRPPFRRATPEEVSLAAKHKKRVWRIGDGEGA